MGVESIAIKKVPPKSESKNRNFMRRFILNLLPFVNLLLSLKK